MSDFGRSLDNTWIFVLSKWLRAKCLSEVFKGLKSDEFI